MYCKQAVSCKALMSAVLRHSKKTHAGVHTAKNIDLTAYLKVEHVVTVSYVTERCYGTKTHICLQNWHMRTYSCYISRTCQGKMLHILVTFQNATKALAIAKCRNKFFLDLTQRVRNHQPYTLWQLTLVTLLVMESHVAWCLQTRSPLQ